MATTELSLGDQITCLISTRGVLAKHHIDDSREIANELIPLIQARERKAKLDVLEKLEDVINNTPTTKENMEYFIALYRAEWENK